MADDELRRAAEKLSKSYAIHQLGQNVNVEVRLENEAIQTRVADAKQVRKLASSDQVDQLNMEVDKINWAQLPPYQGWEAFKARVLRDVEKLPKKFKAFPIERIGMRYQNRIDVPLNEGLLAVYEDYLKVNIDMPDLFDPHDGYSWKIDKHFPNENLSAMVASMIIEPEIPKTVAILLDIDVYATNELPTNTDGLSMKLEQMREFKNKIFETCITDKARESFQ